MIAVWIVLALLLAAATGFGFYMARFSMTGKRQTLDQARAWQEKHYDLSWYDALEKQDYIVKSYDGYELHAQLARNPEPSDRYVIISHGYTDNRFGALKYGKIYLDLGFNLIVYDLRGHGLNAPTFCTYSVRESRDLLAMIDDSRRRWSGMAELGLHGESLGAATTVAVLKYAQAVDFAVADCGFAEITPVLVGGLKAMKLPGWVVHLAGVCAKLRYGYSYGEMRPIDSLAESQVPILFIHGAADDFITPDHSRRMFDAARGEKQLVLIPGASHAMSVLTNPRMYADAVGAFLEELRVKSGVRSEELGVRSEE